MSATPADVVQYCRGCEGITVRAHGEANVLEVARDGITVRVTVPNNVLEWFVDVIEHGERQLQDWCDYEGYDKTPVPELRRDMAKELQTFMRGLHERPFRLNRMGNTATLEWLLDGEWKQAVPLTANA